MSTFGITLDSTNYDSFRSDDFTANLAGGGILLEGDWEVALMSASLWYSFYNIADYLNNNTFRYSTDGGGTWVDVVIPNGAYQIEQINEELHRQMFDNGDYNNTDPNNPVYYVNFEPNFSTLRLRVEITDPLYQVDFTTGDFHILVGFDAIIVLATQEGSDVVDITRGVNSLMIRSNIVSGSWFNNITSDVLIQFIPNTLPGGSLFIQPYIPFYFPVGRSDRIQNIRMYITDNLQRPVNFNGEPVSYQLHFRRVGTR